MAGLLNGKQIKEGTPDHILLISKVDLDVLSTGNPGEKLIARIMDAIQTYKIILVNATDNGYAICTKQALFNDAILLKYESLTDENTAYRILINTTASISAIETIYW